MKNAQKIGLAVAVVLIVVGAIGGIRYFAQPSSDDSGLCIQVITRARNAETGEEKDFATPCDVPNGWEVVESKEVEVSPTTSPSSTVSPKTTWETYQNDRYGFKISFPAGSSVKPSLQEDPMPNRVRIQNYTATESQSGLKSGQYYMEIFINDQEFSCDEELTNPKEFKLGTLTVYRGYGMPGGDAGGTRYGLCVNRSGKHFFVQVTENEKGAIAYPILNSFKFY